MAEPIFIDQSFFSHVKSLIAKGMYGEALIQLRSAINQHPHDAELHYLKGGCLYKVNDYEEAALALNEAVRLAPKHAEAAGLRKKVQEILKESGVDSGGETMEFGKAPTNWFDASAEQIENELKRGELKKKTCPNCGETVLSESWQCGYCGHWFLSHLAKMAVFYVALIVAGLIGLGYFTQSVSRNKEYAGEIVNNAGDNGHLAALTDLRWKCAGLGVRSRVSAGYTGYIRGKIKNIGLKPIEKLNIAFQLYGKTNLATHVWIDVFALPPGKELEFTFANINPPSKVLRCVAEINEVALAETATLDEPISFYIPLGQEFPDCLIVDENKNALHGLRNYMPEGFPFQEDGTLAAPPVKEANFFQKYIPAFIVSFFALFSAAMIMNYIDPDVKTFHKWQADLLASFLAVIAITIINMYGAIGSWFFLFNFLVFVAKVGVILFLFQRSAMQTIGMFIFYILLTPMYLGMLKSIGLA